MIERVSCPICGAGRGKECHQEGDYFMVRCPSCGFVYQNPCPSHEELLDIYHTYLPEGEREIDAWGSMMEPVFIKAADLIERYISPGRILDVGAGYGFFLALMQARGWEVIGLEVSPIGARYGRDRWGLQILPIPWEENSFEEGEFDVVTAFYVIEHLPEPMAFLRGVYRILRHRGIILLRYPHTTPIKDILSLMRIKNQLYHLPFHLHDFSPGTMRMALKNVGFKEIKTLIGGFTDPPELAGRLAGLIFGNLAEILYQLSWGKILLPGVSKTTIAKKVKS
jgi:2-polyprenyl-3-methyl-5-hydroxy-6-metoxy-1,4-benzoquinol methylase